jgi:hypothetical protein
VTRRSRILRPAGSFLVEPVLLAEHASCNDAWHM